MLKKNIGRQSHTVDIDEADQAGGVNAALLQGPWIDGSANVPTDFAEQHKNERIWIGPNATIEEGAIIEPGNLGEGFGTIIMAGAKVCNGVTIGADAIVGENALVGFEGSKKGQRNKGIVVEQLSVVEPGVKITARYSFSSAHDAPRQIVLRKQLGEADFIKSSERAMPLEYGRCTFFVNGMRSTKNFLTDSRTAAVEAGLVLVTGVVYFFSRDGGPQSHYDMSDDVAAASFYSGASFALGLVANLGSALWRGVFTNPEDRPEDCSRLVFSNSRPSE